MLANVGAPSRLAPFDVERDLRIDREAVVHAEGLAIEHHVGRFVHGQLVAEVELERVAVGAPGLAKVVRREREQARRLVEVVARRFAFDRSLRARAARAEQGNHEERRGDPSGELHGASGTTRPEGRTRTCRLRNVPADKKARGGAPKNAAPKPLRVPYFT